MKNYKITLLFLLLSTVAWSQAPLQFNYQAVARDNKGIPLADREIKVRFSIHTDMEEGAIEYSEIRKVKTNPFGMFNVSIGSEQPYYTSGSLQDVKWETGKKYLQIEIDFLGNSNYINMGTTQLVSVPFALFALKTINNNLTAKTGAGNGIEIINDKIQLGNATNDTSTSFSENRYIHTNKHQLIFKEGPSEIAISKELITIQQDSVLMKDETINSGGTFLKVSPIFNREDAVPFLFNRIAKHQLNGTVSPNEVVTWGQNIGAGGGAYLQNLPGIGYSLESNYRPLSNERYVESHEFYINPSGRQVRLKSYTINTLTDNIDFYHTTHTFYLKNPESNQPYFYLSTSTADNNNQQLLLGSLNIDVNANNKQIQVMSSVPNTELFLTSNWTKIYLPGVIMQNDGLHRLFGNQVPEQDNQLYLGNFANRFANISSVQLQGGKLILKDTWSAYDNIQPTSTLDVEGTNGFNQLRLRKSYTPASSSDPNGNVGDLSWDENFIYIKTESGWKRTSLSSF